MNKLVKFDMSLLNWEQPCPKCGETDRSKKSFYESWGKFRCECGKTFKPVLKQRESQPDVKLTGSGVVERTCACGCKEKFFPRIADVNRGWGLYINKSHKAKAQERRTGQHAAYTEREAGRQEDEKFGYTIDYDEGDNHVSN